MKNLFNYLGSLIKEGTGDSSKAFSLVLSAIIGGLIGLCICVVLIWDVCSNGLIDTSLSELGVFLMAVGVFMVGGSASKTISERWENKNKNNKEDETSDFED